MSSEIHKKLTPEEQLKAWNFWKEICCFGGCLPQGEAMQELIQQGKLSEDESEKYYNYFCRQITSYFEDAAGKKCKSLANDLIYEWKREGNEWLLEFDTLFSEYTGSQNEGKRSSTKAWKDDLWLKASHSSSAEIKVIVGGIKYLIMTLIMNWYTKTYGRESFQKKKGENYFDYKPVESLNAPIEWNDDSDPKTLEEKVANPNCVKPFANEVDKPAVKKILNSLTLQEKLLLLSFCAGMDFNREETQNLLGLKKSRTFELWSNIKKKIITSKIDRELATFHFLKNQLIREMSSEKSAEPFLSMLRTSEKGE